ncbi:MAG: hypothetical protein U1E25_16165, partial [Methylocystis sp.]
AILFQDPAQAALVAWLVSMLSRQSGHFFFEPRGYDEINHATQEYKERIKVGYNLHRKRILIAIWALSPLLLLIDPSLLSWVKPATNTGEIIRHVGYIWLAVGAGGFLFRIVQLVKQQGPMTAAVWAVKIVTDPFHDIALYYKSPFYWDQKADHEPFKPHHVEEIELEDDPTPAR